MLRLGPVSKQFIGLTHRYFVTSFSEGAPLKWQLQSALLLKRSMHVNGYIVISDNIYLCSVDN